MVWFSLSRCPVIVFALHKGQLQLQELDVYKKRQWCNRFFVLKGNRDLHTANKKPN